MRIMRTMKYSLNSLSCRGMFQKRAPEVDRPKSRDEVALERKARLKNLAEKEKRGKETATKE